MNAPLNLTLLLSGLLGLIVNWSLPTWKTDYKEMVRNIAIVVFIYVVTQFFITATPQKIFWQVVYVVIGVAVGFAPYTAYKFAVQFGTNLYKKKGQQIEGQITGDTNVPVDKK